MADNANMIHGKVNRMVSGNSIGCITFAMACGLCSTRPSLFAKSYLSYL